MSYKSEKLKIEKTMLDRRRKLSEEQKESIRQEYKTGLVGQRPLAKKYGVSRSLIQIIVNPDIAEMKKQYIKEHWQNYSNREKLTKAARQTRRYKNELFLKGILKQLGGENEINV